MMKVRNTFIIFIVSGFWHGAHWKFIIWGLLNALYIMPSIIFSTNRNNLDIVAKGRIFPTFKELFSIGLTFTLTLFAWIFFRAFGVKHAISYISKIFSGSLFTIPEFHGIESALPILVMTGVFILIEWFGREQQYAIANLELKLFKPARWIMYYSILIAILYFGGKDQQFIYFQF
jgi:alginate O-acetyltransferase complex protein AlgI